MQARRFVVATGSQPAIPPIAGLAETPYLTNDTIFDLEETPRHLIVIGGGPIGMELAQAHRRLGAAVTVLESKTVLGVEDGELAAVVKNAVLREGVDLREYARIESVSHDADEGFTVHLAHDVKVRGSHLLVATGRRANTETLDLSAAGVVTEAGGITVDGKFRTSNKKIYAIGDCAAKMPRFTHAANAMAGLVVRHALFRLPVSLDAATIPRVTYTDPEIASCGLSEEQARAKCSSVSTLRWPFAENDRAQAERAVDGHVKLVVDKKGRVLGVGMAGKNAGEMLPFWALVISQKMNVRAVAETVFPYPVMAEAGKRAAMAHFLPLTQKPALRRLIRFLRIFG